MPYLLITLAYLLGAVPFGLLFAKTAGVDIRRAGSGNIGATNVSRLLGRKLGTLTLLADLGKGLLPMLAVRWLLQEAPLTELWVVLAGAAAFLGHLFPIYLKFKGGKGVATALGVFLFLAPWAVLVCAVIFATVVFFSGYVSLGSLATAALLPLVLWLLGAANLHIGLALFVALFIWLRHYENIGRLLTGQEKSWKNN
ncbi:MAG: acyl-phosphate glycerol 3-phosphate acyltransferase [Deltaproteobacteria bacterium RIFOXYD12_FULL_57_12]|nr:MAG: acyl-phosphate glycerol 3-phosphate acyltransferase [Deltaproteobacteria bacterium RIFOXYD12_FULL_57_12]